MMNAKNSMLALGVCALFASVAGVAQAQSTVPTVQSLIGNKGSVTSGDKLFDQWGNPVTYPAPVVGASGPLSSLAVTPLADNGKGLGINFSFGNSPLAVTGDGGYAFTDFGFSFGVTATDPAQWITGAWLGDLVGLLGSTSALNCTPSGDPLAPCNDLGIGIVEWVYADSTVAALLGTMTAQFSYLDGVQDGFAVEDSISFAGQSSVWVVKDIIVWSVKTTDTATLSSFSQRFTQSPSTNNVPEPSSLLLAGAALLAMVGRRRLS